MKEKIIIDISALAYQIVSNYYVWDVKNANLDKDNEEQYRKEKENIIKNKLEDIVIKKEIMSHLFNKLNLILRNFKFNKEDAFICFDSENKYWRKNIYSEYKDNREETFEKNAIQNFLKEFYTLLKVTNYQVFNKKGIEADEIIYKISEKVSNDGFTPVIYSVDGDLRQTKLKVPNVEFISPRASTKIEYDIFEIKVELLKKIITGDRKDNILGIKLYPNIELTKIRNMRFGEKTIFEKYKDIISNSPNDIDGFNKTLDIIKNDIILEFSKIDEETAKKIGKNFELNQKLINISLIPNEISEQIDLILDSSEHSNEIEYNDYEKSIYLSNILKESSYKSISNFLEIPYLLRNEEILKTETLKHIDYLISISDNNYKILLSKIKNIVLIEKNGKAKRISPFEIKIGDQIKVDLYKYENSKMHTETIEIKVSDIVTFDNNFKKDILKKIEKYKSDIEIIEKKIIEIQPYFLNSYQINTKEINKITDNKVLFKLDNLLESIIKIEIEKDPKTISFFNKYMPTFNKETFLQIIEKISSKKEKEYIEKQKKEHNILKELNNENSMIIENIK